MKFHGRNNSNKIYSTLSPGSAMKGCLMSGTKDSCAFTLMKTAHLQGKKNG